MIITQKHTKKCHCICFELSVCSPICSFELFNVTVMWNERFNKLFLWCYSSFSLLFHYILGVKKFNDFWLRSDHSHAARKDAGIRKPKCYINLCNYYAVLKKKVKMFPES
jgi:hypothetical protein